jgi:NADPH-dependent curcumin reductase CurA
VAKSVGCKDTINSRKYYTGEKFRAVEFERDVRKMMNREEIDLYYENVGEDMLTSMLKLMAEHSKIVMCGATATYNNWGQKAGVKNMENIISKRIEMKGILYYNLDINERVSAFVEMNSLEVKGVDVIIKGI